ncbi:MAG: GNAT family N-acetyltransferase [Tepidiformaceae bacterium]
MVNSIRRATVADVRELAEIHIAGWRGAYQHIFPPEMFAARTVDVRELEFRDLFSKDAAPCIWVSESAGRIVGFAYTRPGEEPDVVDGGELKLFYVLPELRGTGIGLPLFEYAVADLATRGLEPYLYTLRDNAAARAWYAERGWRHDGAVALWSDRGEYPEILEVRYRPDSADPRSFRSLVGTLVWQAEDIITPGENEWEADAD